MQAAQASTARNAWFVALFVVLVIGGVGRLQGIESSKINFHTPRQMLGLIESRAYWVGSDSSASERSASVARAQLENDRSLEPDIMPRIVGTAYGAAGREVPLLWPVLSSLAWLALAGLVADALRRRGLERAGLAAAIFLCFSPFLVEGSRTSMVDPVAVALGCSAALVAARSDTRTWRIDICVAMLVAAATVLKAPIGLVAFAGVVGVALDQRDSPVPLRRLPLAAGAAFALASLATVVPFVSGSLDQYAVTSFQPRLLFSLSHLAEVWKVFSETAPVVILVLFVVLACVRTPKPVSGLARGWLVGGGAYGVLFIYHLGTHDYYTLVFAPLFAIGFGVACEMVLRFGDRRELRRIGAITFVVVMVAIVFAAVSRDTFAVVSPRPDEVAALKELNCQAGAAVGNSIRVAYLTNDYGGTLEYFGWVSGKVWPTSYDRFVQERAGSPLPSEALLIDEFQPDYFVATSLRNLDQVPDLQLELDRRAIERLDGEKWSAWRLNARAPALNASAPSLFGGSCRP
jgi:hypothetical protein